MKNNQGLRIIVELIGGMIFSFLLCGLFIYLGYSNFYRSNLKEYIVTIFGFPIYEIVLENSKGIGTALNQNMSIIGIVCSIVFVLFIETIILLKCKNSSDKK